MQARRLRVAKMLVYGPLRFAVHFSARFVGCTIVGANLRAAGEGRAEGFLPDAKKIRVKN